MTETTTNKSNRKAIIQGSLVIGLPLLAMAAAYLFFPANSQQKDDLLSWLGTTNHGTLVEPRVSIAGDTFSANDGQPWQVGANNKWKLMVATHGTCDDACQQALYLTRQIHKLIPKRINRLERFYISSQPASPDLQQLLESEHGNIPALLDSSGVFFDKIAQSNAPDDCQGCYYLIAPDGEMVLFYTPQHEYKKVIKDLKVLL
ncbi:hypothetical protein QSV34_05550 [Porticoccus sp. W117]|uniref:hypothetical protein n=1 Tax=Porticoccus sp. W117 TaxID=3054777 RepID=UPI00259342EB|nr:hypothetical protein [Porticoccus sp. W117]MDM3870815.1 hypothetical protein [Porticoccus sp. W117]